MGQTGEEHKPSGERETIGAVTRACKVMWSGAPAATLHVALLSLTPVAAFAPSAAPADAGCPHSRLNRAKKGVPPGCNAVAMRAACPMARAACCTLRSARSTPTCCMLSARATGSSCVTLAARLPSSSLALLGLWRRPASTIQRDAPPQHAGDRQLPKTQGMRGPHSRPCCLQHTCRRRARLGWRD
jgi:hypothetical protein